MPQQYRKKPVIIEATEWNGATEDAIQIIDWVTGNGSYAIYHENIAAGDPTPSFGWITIETLEGTMRADVGDFIIRGVNNEFYPCKPDIFAKTYEQVA
jgi:hypothetical protein